MAIYELDNSNPKPSIKDMDKTTFESQGIKEREDIQAAIKERVEIISPGTMVISEEFSGWESSQRRIDLLCIEKEEEEDEGPANANLVVVELKRTETGGHMDLQAIRYAAMVSTMTFDEAAQAYAKYLRNTSDDDSIQEQARAEILEFLGWEEPIEEKFAQAVRIVLASAEFSIELTSAVLWLNERGLDITCVRMIPYRDGNRTLLDIQQAIPLPEAEEYQIQVRHKKQKEESSRASSKDYTKFTLQVGQGNPSRNLNKRKLMYQLIKGIVESGVRPDEIEEKVTKKKLFASFDGKLNGSQFEKKLLANSRDSRGIRRYFFAEEELFYDEGNDKTYALTNQWGIKTRDVANELKEKFPQLNISFDEEESV